MKVVENEIGADLYTQDQSLFLATKVEAAVRDFIVRTLQFFSVQ
jgi:hypothetical protein